MAATATAKEVGACWICGAAELRLAKPSNLPGPLDSRHFSITDSHYGTTAAIYKCPDCGFLQCAEMAEVLSFYEKLEDQDYEAGRAERSLQSRGILDVLRRIQPGGRLLDIGAGTGMLVEQALQMGYRAEGIEPSQWLHSVARRRNLPVHLGTFPAPETTGRFDAITLIDVIEHVPNPVELLRGIAANLADAGYAIIVTPDVGSLAARILKWRWWHFRIAHIGYFDKRTLYRSLQRAGLRPVLLARPGWFFTADYLWARVRRYLPAFLRLGTPRFLRRIVIPLNLRDSWLVVCARER
jgi:SAM-dependent methyltransferase